MAEAEVEIQNKIETNQSTTEETIETNTNNAEKSGDEECPEFDDDYFNDIGLKT